ncbi:unnamed protein product [Blepharisma stoltei]|uniref:FYVE-type domain-containing protein n=1 Tax=Blepharisma stoltei TaxID=1481888 RepID=A0AAU9J2A0_9CILI|nr:unnamed protein product [Blepharisma stoltei]
MDLRQSEIIQDFAQKETRPVSMSVFATLDPELGQETYKKDRSCAKCGSIFILGINSKNICPFCHRGYCKNCFLQQIPHPETNEMTGICDECNKTYIKAQVNDQFDSLLVELKEEVKDLREKYNEEVSKTKTEIEIKRATKEQYRIMLEEKNRKDQEMVNFLEKFREANINLDLQYTELNEKIEEMLESSNEKDIMMNKLREEADDVQMKSMKCLETADELCGMIEEQKEENEKVRGEVKRVEEFKQNNDIHNNLEGLTEEELANMINGLRENTEKAKKEKKILYKRTVELRNEENLNDKIIAILEKNVEIFGVKKETCKNAVEIKLQIKEQMKEIAKLRDELRENVKKQKRKSIVSKECKDDPIVQTRKGKCI